MTETYQRVGAGIVAALVVAAAWTALAVPAAFTTQDETRIDSCTTITEPGRYVLAADVEDSTADVCIDVRASDVVVDGAGHTVAGNLTLADLRGVEVQAPAETFVPWIPRPDGRVGIGVGVANATAPSNVTVTNVTVTNWVLGVLLEGTSDVTVRDVTAGTNGAGVFGANASDTLVAATDASDNVVIGVGFDAESSAPTSGNAVVDTVASGNDRNGVWLTNATGTVLRNVTADDNGVFGVVLAATPDSLATDVTARGNGFVGLILESFPGMVTPNGTVADGNFERNGYGGMALVGFVNSTVANVSVAGTVGTLPANVTRPFPAIGLVVAFAAGNVVTDVDARNQSAWAYQSPDGGVNVVRNLRTDVATVSFEGRNVGLGPTATTVSGVDPNATQVGAGLTVTNLSPDAFVDLRVQWGTPAAGNAPSNESPSVGGPASAFAGPVPPPTPPGARPGRR